MLKKSSSSVQIFYPRFNKEEIIQAISRGLEKIGEELPLLLVVLFGSYAKGNYTVASDVDLLVVYRGEEKGDAYSIIKRAVDVPRLEPHVYSEKEYREMKETIRNMIRDGILLYQEKEHPSTAPQMNSRACR